MKNLLSAVLFLTIFTTLPVHSKSLAADRFDIPNALKVTHSFPDSESLSGACRTYNVSVTAFGVNVSTTLVLCCRPNIGVFPHVICFETTIPSTPPGGGALIGDILLSDFGAEAQKIFQQGKDLTSIAITKSNSNDIEGKQYYIKSDTYKIMENAKKEQFIRVILEPEK